MAMRLTSVRGSVRLHGGSEALAVFGGDVLGDAHGRLLVIARYGVVADRAGADSGGVACGGWFL